MAVYKTGKTQVTMSKYAKLYNINIHIQYGNINYTIAMLLKLVIPGQIPFSHTNGKETVIKTI